MSRTMKWVLGIFVGIVIVLGAATAAVKILFPQEKIRALLLDQLQSQLHREAKLGEIHLSLLQGVEIADFAISENPNFSAGTFAQSKKFVLRMSFLALIQKQIAVEKIVLEDFSINVVRRKDGVTYNFSDLLKTEQPPAANAPSTPPSALKLSLSQAQIKNGAFQFRDESPAAIDLSVENLNLKIQAQDFDRPIAFDGSLHLKLKSGPNVFRGELATQGVLQMKSQSLNLTKLDWKMPGVEIYVSGKIDNFASPTLDLELKTLSLDLERLPQAAAVLPKGLKISGSPVLSLKATGNLNSLKLQSQLNFTDTQIEWPQMLSKAKALPLEVDVAGVLKAQKVFSCSLLKMNLNGALLQGQGEIADVQKNPAAGVWEITASQFPLEKPAAILPQLKDYSPLGTLDLKANFDNRSAPPKWKATIALQNASATSKPYRLSQINLQAQATEISARVSQLTGSVQNADKTPLQFSLSADYLSSGPHDAQVDLHGALKTLDLAAFMDDKKTQENKKPASETATSNGQKTLRIKTKGALSIERVLYPKFEVSDVKANWNLINVGEKKAEITGDLAFETGAGKMQDLPLWKNVASTLRMDPSALAFTRIGGHFKLAANKAQTQDLALNGPLLDAAARGFLTLEPTEPEMIVTLKLPKGSLGGIAAELTQDADGRPTVIVRLEKGWKATLDTSAVTKKAVEKAADEIKKRANDFIQNEGKKMLEGIFKR